MIERTPHTELNFDLHYRLESLLPAIEQAGFKVQINPRLYEGRGWVLQGARSFKMTEYGMEVLEAPEFGIHYTTDESNGRQLMFTVQVEDMDPQDKRNEPTIPSTFATPEEAVESLLITLRIQNHTSSQ